MARLSALRLLAVVAVCSISLVALQTDAATAAAPRIWQTPLASTGPSTFNSVSCATTAVCTAVGSGASGFAAAYGTTDGGTSWAHESTPTGAVGLDAVSCPTPSFCLASGAIGVPTASIADFFDTTDGGATWSYSGDVLSDTGIVRQLDCVTPSTCFMLFGDDGSYELMASTNDGALWTAIGPSTVGSQLHLTCPTVTTCFTVGYGEASTGTGPLVVERWTMSGSAVTVYSGKATDATGLSSPSISCTTASVCMVVGGGSTGAEVLTTTNGGATWRTRSLPSGLSSAVSVSCAPGARCAIAFARVSAIDEAVTSVGGKATWSTRPIAAVPRPQGAQLECPSVVTCFAVAPGSSGDGLHWQSQSLAFSPASIRSGPGGLNAVTCPTDTECVAVGRGDVVLTTDGGETWSGIADAGVASADLTSVGCASATDCAAVGWELTAGVQSGVAYVSTDGGEHWLPAALPDGEGSLQGVTCPSSTSCVAVSETDPSAPILISNDAGASWLASAVARTQGAGFFSVSCGSPTTCVAVGSPYAANSLIAISSDAGETWTYAYGPLDPQLVSVTCASAEDCTADGIGQPLSPGDSRALAYGTTDGGLTWTELSQLPSDDVTALSCASMDCEAIATQSWGDVASQLDASADGAATWTTETLPVQAFRLNAVTSTPDGRWIVVGSDSFNGALAISN